MPGVGIYFSSLHWLKNYIEIDTEPTAAQAILLGMGARSISAVCLIPMTVVKTRIEVISFLYYNLCCIF